MKQIQLKREKNIEKSVSKLDSELFDLKTKYESIQKNVKENKLIRVNRSVIKRRLDLMEKYIQVLDKRIQICKAKCEEISEILEKEEISIDLLNKQSDQFMQLEKEVDQLEADIWRRAKEIDSYNKNLEENSLTITQTSKNIAQLSSQIRDSEKQRAENLIAVGALGEKAKKLAEQIQKASQESKTRANELKILEKDLKIIQKTIDVSVILK